MFSFLGSKSKIARYYPAPIYETIIEPFAGSAKYSMLHWQKNVILLDIDPVICSVWAYLKGTTPERILSLPDVPNATLLESIDGFSKLCQEEKWLIGFCCNGGSATPKNVSGRHNFNSWNRDKVRISNDLYKIKHWRIYNLPYWEVTSVSPATWYIDPPYKEKGKWYKHNQIDYDKLATWCKSRIGQVMVCENVGADWLPFVPFREIPFSHFKTEADKKKKTQEAIWYAEHLNEV